jgi:hypothetical protein
VLSEERGRGQQRSFVYDRGGESTLARGTQALQIPDGGGAKQRPAERVAQQVNRSKPRGQGRRPAMGVDLRAARENGGGAGDKAETQRACTSAAKSRSPCGHGLGALQCCRKHGRRTCQGGTGDLGGRANSVDSDRQSSVGGRTMRTSASRLPEASTICRARNKQHYSPDSWL